MKNIHPKCFSCSNGNFSWSDQTFCEISLLEFVSKRLVLNDFESKWPVSIPPYILLMNQLLKKMNPFVWFASLTNGLFFKDGSNILSVQCNLDMYSVVFFV